MLYPEEASGLVAQPSQIVTPQFDFQANSALVGTTTDYKPFSFQVPKLFLYRKLFLFTSITPGAALFIEGTFRFILAGQPLSSVPWIAPGTGITPGRDLFKPSFTALAAPLAWYPRGTSSSGINPIATATLNLACDQIDLVVGTNTNANGGLVLALAILSQNTPFCF